MFALGAAIVMSGCGANQFQLLGSPVAGSVYVAQQPAGGVSIQLYRLDAGATATPTPLLRQPAHTAADGTFAITDQFVCPSAASQIYAIVRGSASDRTTLGLVAAVGDCFIAGSRPAVRVDELSTLSAAYALAPVLDTFQSAAARTVTNTQVQDAFQFAASLQNQLSKAAAAPDVPSNQTAPTQKLMTLASITSTCLADNSASGSTCTRLFTETTPPAGGAPSDTAAAMLQVAKNPKHNVDAIYALKPQSTAFQPTLFQSPRDWTLTAVQAPAPPVITPASGTYTTAQTVTLTAADTQASLFYSLGSGWIPYTAPVPVGATATFRAIAVDTISSEEATASYSIVPGSLTVNAPARLTVGEQLSGTVTLSAPATKDGVVVTLATSTPAVAAPTSQTVMVAAKQVTANFTLRAIASGSTKLSVTAPGYGSASTAVAVAPVNISASPAAVTLNPSQAQQFTATVTGSTNTAATWTMSPNVGTLSSTGLYTAPATITAAQTVTLTATSSADSSKTATAVVLLKPTVAITAGPASVSLGAGQAQQFTATVTGTTNTAATWTMSPAVGALTSAGFYTAPATITAPQTVTLTATSSADPSKTATVIVSLKPTVAITASPAGVSLGAGQAQQFAATVTGSTNTAATWKMSPAIGTLSTTGLYTAPANITAPQTVTLIATSNADASKFASVTVRLMAPAAVTAPTPTATLTLSVPSSTIPLGATLTGSLTLSAASTTSTAVSLTSSNTASVSVSPTSLVIPAGQTIAHFTVSGVSLGTATITSQAAGFAPSSTTLKTLAAAVPAQFFGMSVQNFTKLTPSLSYATARSWDADHLAWTDMNPSRGTYDFSALDAFVRANQSRDIVYTFGRTPQWASSRPNQASIYGPGQCAAPADLAVWDEYVRAIVTHAAGRIQYWELWNEPSSQGYFCGDMPTLVAMSARAYAIIKSINPSAVVLSPPMVGTSATTWLGYYLFLGGAKYADVISFHGYTSFSAEELTATVALYRVVMAANGVGNKPLWDTESSWAGDGSIGTPPMQQQVGFMAKSYALHLSLGVSRFIWYAYDGGQTWGGLVDANGKMTAAGTAYAETSRWLVGASLTTPCTSNLLGTYSCGFTRTGGYTAQMMWNSLLPQTVTVPSEFVEYRDLAGTVHTITNHRVTVGDQPILLESGALPQ